MKKCPKCKTNYTDETLVYCLSDGTALSPDLTGEKTHEFQNTTVGGIQNKSDEPELSDKRANATTVKFNEPKEKKGSGSFWKFTTFGLFGVLIVVMVSFWFVFPERFRALSSAIPIPGFSSSSQEIETDSGGQGKGGSTVEKTEKQTSNPNQTQNQETNGEKPENEIANGDVGIAGKWEIALRTPRRDYPLFFDLEYDEEGNIVGESNSPFGKEEIREGKFENGVLTLKLTKPTGLTFIGNVKGKNIEGKVLTKLGPTTFKGTKVEEPNKDSKLEETKTQEKQNLFLEN